MLRLTIIGILFYSNSFGQTNNFSDKIKIADSIVLENTSFSFFKYITPKRDTSLVFLTYPAQEKLFFIYYDFLPIKGQEYFIKDKGFGSLGFAIALDSNNILRQSPDFNHLVLAINKLEKSEIINESIAVDISQTYFSKKTRDTHRRQLTYQVIDDRLTWRITRHKGFRKVTEETIIIDAINSEYVSKDEFVYHRTIWQAMGDLFSGFY